MARLSDLIIGHPEVTSFADWKSWCSISVARAKCSWNSISNPTTATRPRSGNGSSKPPSQGDSTMTDSESYRDIATLDLPYARKAVVREVRFESGMVMTRLILREGKRITQIDLDGPSARALAAALSKGAVTCS